MSKSKSTRASKNTVAVEYVGRYASVDVEVAPRRWDTVARGETITVPSEIAGTPPKGDDPGAGLLAQPDNWHPATPSTQPTTPAPAAEQEA